MRVGIERSVSPRNKPSGGSVHRLIVLKSFALVSVMLGAAMLAACSHDAAPPRAPRTNTASKPVAAAPSFGASDVDALLRKAWTAKGVTPTARADDATFLRRVYVDIVGTIPPPEKVLAFTADASPDKRAKLVDELLASPAYAEHWADYWEDELLGQARAGDIDRLALRLWLRDQFAKNVAWDKIVFALVTASGQNSVGGAYVKTPSEAEREIAKSETPINGAVNYVLKFRDTPQDWAGSASKTFLGVQIQCAQCHDHKTEKWKQQDFQKFAACFMRAQTLPLDGPMMKGLKRALVRDIDRPLPRFMRDADLQPIGRAAPTALDGTAMTGNVRDSIAHWMTTSSSFSRAAVNRMWGHFLGRGFVDPIDDLRDSNPSDAPELEEALSKDFASHQFDLKRLMRTIALSQVYGLSTAPSASQDAKTPPVLWSRFRATPLGPNEMIDAVIDATAVDDALRRLGRFNVEELTEKLRTFYGFVFDVDEEFDRPTFEGTITQALIQLNGRLIAGGSTAFPGTVVSTVAHSGMTDAQRVEALYLRTLSRKPTAEETSTWTNYLANPPALDASQKRFDAPKRIVNGKGADPLARAEGKLPETHDPKIAALEDIMWTLLNSSEFVLNH
jgi:hypothetical protein